VLENRMLGNIFCSEKETVPGEWRELHNEEFRKLYSSPNIFWAIKKWWEKRWEDHVMRKRNTCRVLMGEPERCRPL